jgi:aspartate/methionine/tyrosine aminotransferase
VLFVPKLSTLALSQKRSGIREIMDLSASLEGVIHLEVGEPQFNTPDHIIEGAFKAAKEGYTKYTASAGLLSLRGLIADRLNNDYGVSLKPEEVVVTVGGIGAISSAIRALTDLGDEVLVPDPCWPNYMMIITCLGAKPIRYKLDPLNDYQPSIEEIESLINPKTKAIIVNSPSNPLGVVFPEHVISNLVDLARRKDIFLISDEVYEKIIFEGRHYSALSYDTDGRVIATYSFAKTYAMTGWRIGYAAAAESIALQIAKLQEAFVSCASSVSQKAAEAALMGSQDCVEKMRLVYENNMKVAKKILDRYGISYQEPHGAFYLWININCDDSTEFARNFLLKEKVAVAPGNTFGDSGRQQIRISLASAQESIEIGLERLNNFLNNS